MAYSLIMVKLAFLKKKFSFRIENMENYIYFATFQKGFS